MVGGLLALEKGEGLDGPVAHGLGQVGRLEHGHQAAGRAVAPARVPQGRGADLAHLGDVGDAEGLDERRRDLVGELVVRLQALELVGAPHQNRAQRLGGDHLEVPGVVVVVGREHGGEGLEGGGRV
ncbi:MAG TPA: hypothetical protein P5532_22015, partial [Planctomycetota bacterium]|nr:hypothetical protein [Planctomycetota bacterium]